MDETDARAAMIKATRREILNVLNIMYGIGPFGFPSICQALLHLQLPDERCVQRDLTYLADKKYVEWVNPGKRGFVPWKDRFFRLTATGNEMANAISSDPALEP